MKIIVDTSSWIDYFEGNNKGKQIKTYLDNNTHEIITNVTSIAEIASFFSRKKLDYEKAIKIISGKSKIFLNDLPFSKEAGVLHAEIKNEISDFGLNDTLILLTARKIGAKLLTCDFHFKKFKETILIK